MTRRRILVSAAIVTLLCAAFLVAKDFWEKPYKEWKKGDVVKMLTNSPWAQQQQVADVVGSQERKTPNTSPEEGKAMDISTGPASDKDRKGSGVGGEKEIANAFTVRLFSSLPVRQAYVRMFQIANNYDEKNPSERAQMDERLSRALRIDFSKTIMVALEFKSNTQERRTNMERYLTNLKVDQLKQSCYLISDRIGRVTIEEYYPPSPDGSGAKFVFPREVDGKPVAAPEDKELKFDFWCDAAGQRVFITFKVKNLMFDGKLEL